jgi:predicted regulator of Ras-like GTPase activity (Roadblock/LC7/MglB family)
VLMAYAEANLLKGNRFESMKAYQKVISLQPDNSDVRIALAKIYFSMKNYDDTFGEVIAVLETTPKNIEAHLLLKKLNRTVGIPEHYRDILESHLEFTTSPGQVNMMQKHYEMARRRYEVLIEDYNRQLEEDEDHPVILYNRIKARERSKLAEETLEDLATMIGEEEEEVLPEFLFEEPESQVEMPEACETDVEQETGENEELEILGDPAVVMQDEQDLIFAEDFSEELIVAVNNDEPELLAEVDSTDEVQIEEKMQPEESESPSLPVEEDSGELPEVTELPVIPIDSVFTEAPGAVGEVAIETDSENLETYVPVEIPAVELETVEETAVELENEEAPVVAPVLDVELPETTMPQPEEIMSESISIVEIEDKTEESERLPETVVITEETESNEVSHIEAMPVEALDDAVAVIEIRSDVRTPEEKPQQVMGEVESVFVSDLTPERVDFYEEIKEKLGSVLSSVNKTRGISTSFVMDEFGTIIHSRSTEKISLNDLGEQVLQGIKPILQWRKDNETEESGKLTFWVLEFQKGLMVLHPVKDQIFLVVLGVQGANFGGIKFSIEKNAGDIARLFENMPE